MHKERLSKEELKRLKGMCKEGNYEAIVALLNVHLEEAMARCATTQTDHRFIQGKFQGLLDFRDDITRESK